MPDIEVTKRRVTAALLMVAMLSPSALDAEPQGTEQQERDEDIPVQAAPSEAVPPETAPPETAPSHTMPSEGKGETAPSESTLDHDEGVISDLEVRVGQASESDPICGRPIAGASVTLTWVNAPDRPERTAMTDGKGIAQIKGLARGRIRIQVLKPEWCPGGNMIVLEQPRHFVPICLNAEPDCT